MSIDPRYVDLVSLDVESELIAPGRQAPPLVCVQWCDATAAGIIHARLNRRELFVGLCQYLDPKGSWVITGHNIGFDMAAIAAFFPELIPAIFAAYERGAIHCSMIREQLLDIAEGTRKKLYDLESVCNRYQGLPPVHKDNPWRLRFAELANVPVAEWPREATSYGLGDVYAQRGLHIAQDARAARYAPDTLVDECRQCAADFWLKLCSCWGVHTDPEAVERFYVSERARLDSHRIELIAAGLVRPNGVRNMDAAKRVMEAACADAELPIPTTESGDVSLSEDSINLTGHELLIAFQQYGAAKTVLARIERLRFGDRFPIQARFNCLQGTGRTSCSMGDPKPGATGQPAAYGYQMQNTARKAGVKECFVPRPGCWFLSVDYTGQELRTWAYACFRILGASRLMQVLNSGLDPHTDLAAGLGGVNYATAVAILKGSEGDERKHLFKDQYRQTAKIANFGYPGGMGPKRLVVQARAQYNVPITLDAATTLRDTWRENWPEARPYFKYVNDLLNGHDKATIKHLLSDRYRGNIGYCEIANSFFQGLAADIAKEAGFLIAKACYVHTGSPLFGCRVWNFIHDEFLLEVPANPYRATLAGWEVSRIMVETAARWMPELEAGIEALPAITLRWSKEAVTKIAKSGPYQGCLIPSEWDESTGLP